ncbi:hypothetical protein [Priestia megaterium]|uniref:hypothetical protein n=1 Tax=Priestia megaterium TaxID=1404 RepID=UPI002453404E|nr:hypothetical protein [Priestia megaterium]MDH3183661.1 hypothetical protein [Priestia megaterium]
MTNLGLIHGMTLMELIILSLVFVFVWGGIPALMVKVLLNDNKLAKIAFVLSVGSGIFIYIQTGQLPYGIAFR